MEIYEKELQLRESRLESLRTSMDGNEDFSRSVEIGKTVELQEIAINIAEECKKVMNDLYHREQSLTDREVKLKQMVELVQSIQNRQSVAKEELNRAIEKDEKKIREKMIQLESRERRIEILKNSFLVKSGH